MAQQGEISVGGLETGGTDQATRSTKPVIHTVQWPDGHVEKWVGPENLTEDEIATAAEQHRAMNEGRIATTKMQGALPEYADVAANTLLNIGSVMLPGAAGIASGVIGPAVGRGARELARFATGQPVNVPDTGEAADIATQNWLMAVPAAGMAARGIAKATVPHISPLTGRYVPGLGKGVWSGIGRGIGEGLNAIVTPLEGAQRILNYPVTRQPLGKFALSKNPLLGLQAVPAGVPQAAAAPAVSSSTPVLGGGTPVPPATWTQYAANLTQQAVQANNAALVQSLTKKLASPALAKNPQAKKAVQAAINRLLKGTP